MVKVNPTQVLKDFDGKDLEQGKEKIKVEVKSVLVSALAFEDQELKTNPEQKVRAYELSVKLMNDAEVELKSEDVVFLKPRLNKLYTPVIFGQVMKILENEVLPVDKK